MNSSKYVYTSETRMMFCQQSGVPSANTCAVQKAITHICIQTIILYISSSNPCSPIQECKLNISLCVSFSFLHICSEVSHKHTESTQFTHSTQSNTHMHESTHTYIHTNESPLTHTHIQHLDKQYNIQVGHMQLFISTLSMPDIEH